MAQKISVITNFSKRHERQKLLDILRLYRVNGYLCGIVKWVRNGMAEYVIRFYGDFSHIFNSYETQNYLEYEWFIDPFKNFRFSAEACGIKIQILYRIFSPNNSENILEKFCDSAYFNDEKSIKYYIDHYTTSLGREILPLVC